MIGLVYIVFDEEECHGVVLEERGRDVEGVGGDPGTNAGAAQGDS